MHRSAADCRIFQVRVPDEIARFERRDGLPRVECLNEVARLVVSKGKMWDTAGSCRVLHEMKRRRKEDKSLKESS